MYNFTIIAAAEKAPFDMSLPYIATSFELFGITFNLTSSVVTQWIVMVFLGILFFVLGRNLKVKPTGKRQMIAEAIVTFFRDMVIDGMGEKYVAYTPYIATVLISSLSFSLSGLFGYRPPTADIMVLGSWGIITFILTQRNKFKTGGVKGFFKSFIDPTPVMLPMNLVGELTNPLSQVFRHFGNILGGMLIMGIVYWALGSFAVVVPAVLSLYFDLFSATIQAYIFAMLTMVYVSSADCSE
ncbi:MAG: F0F1 ATP synthase subunit A [Oscillospiraceae bacterium]|nr:F0F1 ATP synthase subunit A [Oscillospiraceae bacterium]